MYQSISIGVGTIVYFFSAGIFYFSVLRQPAWVKKIFYSGAIFLDRHCLPISANLDQLMTASSFLPIPVAYYNVASRINLLVDIPSFCGFRGLFPKASRAFAEEDAGKIRYRMSGWLPCLLPLLYRPPCSS